MSILLLMVTASTAAAQCYPETYGANPNDQIDDHAAIQQCLDQGGTTILNGDVQYGYYIDSPLSLTHSGTVLTGTSNFGYRALLVATAQLDANGGGPILAVDGAVNSYTVSNIMFFGNMYNRPSPVCGSDRGANMWMRGDGAFAGAILFDNNESREAPCGTSMNVSASNFEIRNSWFVFNGSPGIQGGGGGPYADGLTVW